MNCQFLFIFLVCCLVNATKESPFLKYNLQKLKEANYESGCQNPEFYIEMADIEESKPANQDKIILYHGETYGVWIYQMILKVLKYPEAPEDWLPLRSETLKSEIGKDDLLHLIKLDSFDHDRAFTQIGLSVTPNLYSRAASESAWGNICQKQFKIWHKITGFSDRDFHNSLHHQLYTSLKEKYIPRELWGKFKMQKKLLNYFIQEKRGQSQRKIITDYNEKVEEYFPKTFRRFPGELNFIEQHESKHSNYLEGVALQIIMDKELADRIVYDSIPFGYLKNRLEPELLYSYFYEKGKNIKDDQQARLALTIDFRRYPSRVRIKAIAGIMENPLDYEIVKCMIREMVDFKGLY